MQKSLVTNYNSDRGYLNILLNNNTDETEIAEYNETQKQPILTNMQDFMLGVVRMKVPTSAIPLNVFEDNAYYIGLSLGNTDTNVISQVVTYNVPSGVSPLSPQNRYIYYYNQLMTSINDALAAAWIIAIPTAAYIPIIGAGLPAPYTAEDVPLFRLKGDGQYIELLLPQKAGNNPRSPFFPFNPAGVNILMSHRLFHFMSGFSAQNNKAGFDLGVSPIPLTHKLQPGPYINDSTKLALVAFPPNAAVNYNVVQQDFPSLFLWSTLSRIIITTSIQLEKEVILTKTNNGLTNKQEVLADFEIPQANGSVGEYIYFQPQGPLRYSNFKATGWLDRFDMKIFFQTNDLQIFPLEIPPLFETSLKIEFKRRKAHDLLQYSGDSNNLQFF